MPKSKKTKKTAIQYSLEQLVPFSNTIYNQKFKNFIDILNNTFVGKQLNIKRTGNVFEQVNLEEDEDTIDNAWAKIVQNGLVKSIIINLLDQLKPKLYKKLNQQYRDNSEEIREYIKEWLNKL